MTIDKDSNKILPGILDLPMETVSAEDKKALIMAVEGTFDTLFTWNYEQGENKPIETLYKKAKTSQWDSDLDIDWTIKGQIDRARDPRDPMNRLCITDEGVFGRLNAKERANFGHASISWTISQFLHAEQGALTCAARLVQQAPWVDTKFCASTQVMEEARHMEVYAKYLREKLEWEFPVNVHLRGLLKDIVSDSRWDFTFLGMQVVIEGLALAAFGFQYQLTKDSLLKQITRYIMADEARHVAFGVLSLREVYSDLTSAELRERQEFCYECALRLRDRFLAQEVWEALDLPVKECMEIMKRNPVQIEFRRALFSKVVPSVKKLGLLDFGDGWLRNKFGELGVLKYEDMEDASAEYHRMDLDHAPWSVIRYKHY
ncbi:ferritin-like domain-containing protein [Bradyrhizobium sp. I71]|uniref:ferritin-like domain-containing protein n=1 Tax=Bradyrhizobium sp. I71 TaxID=2590772 RepID=UPI001EF7B9B7|nr:ferritin-like domain-containing protein [Bradyrhizobium sp. I71]ULK98532.1 ferritin-like domain-containing protein [Bradyrhizobium sp. I71]